MKGYDVLTRMYKHSELDFINEVEDEKKLMEDLVGIEIAEKLNSTKVKALGVSEGGENAKIGSGQSTAATPKTLKSSRGTSLDIKWQTR